MGEWKAPLSLRVLQQCRLDLEEIAKHEKRTLGNLGSLLVEWATEQLKAAGSTTRLLKRKAPIPRNPDGNYKRTFVPKEPK